MAGRKSDFTLPKFDDIFSTQEMRDDEKLAKIRDIPLELIDNFPDHPYRVQDDEDMMQLAESIKERGVITPATVRQKEDGRYELISGHRRKRASELAGFETLRCEVVDLTRDEAIILMVLFLDESDEMEQECTLTREFLRKERDVRNLMNDMNSSLQSVKKLLFDLQTEKFSNLKPVLSGEYTDELIMLVSEFPVKKEGIDIEFLRQTISKIIVQADGNIRIRFVNGKEIGNELEVAR